MIAIELLVQLQKIPATRNDAIVDLVSRQKSVFDKPGLAPNVIDCIDRAVASAKTMRQDKKFSEAYRRISGSYGAFLTMLDLVEKSQYWEHCRRTKPEGSQQRRQVQMIATSRDVEEIKALRDIFNIYSRATLIQNKMRRYARKLIY
ncbi:hypothetical protein HYY70_03685 [Candidatus Woesearchaeota archaeon]|nr:hypothetical protein [Candidatus Woesearchaeota archaeon]